MFKKIFKILDSKEKKFFLIILILILINAVLETIGVVAIVPLIGLITQGDFLENYSYASNFLMNLSKVIQPNYVYENNSVQTNLIVGGVTGFLILFLFKTTFFIFLTYLHSTFSHNLISTISNKLYNGYLNLNYIFHTLRNSTNLKQNILEEAPIFAGTFNSYLVIITESFILLFITIFLLSYNWISSTVIFIFLTAISYAIYKITKPKLIFWGSERMRRHGKAFKYLQEGLESIKEVYILQKSLYFFNNFKKNYKDSLIVKRNNEVTRSASRPIYEFIGVLCLVILLLVLIFQGSSIDNLLVSIGLFLAASFRLLPSLNRIITNVQQIKFNAAGVDRITQEFEIINNNFQLSKSNSALNFEKDILFNNVTFYYPNKNIPALKNINFSIKKGSKFGIKGKSGSGKSTLINLFLTLIKPREGQIKVDGMNLEQSNSSWLKNIGYVAQEVNLTDDTIEKNIAFGLPNEKIDFEKVKKAIKFSQLSTFIDSLKDGIKTRVGEKGLMVSGGQKQRIGIARALYNNPSVLILDESTSSLDLSTEKLIMDTIYKLGEHKTVIIVSHRVSAIDRCDDFITLSNGEIIEKNI